MDELFITNFRILLVPLVGCLIGYITNDLAIKMLFRPRKPVYIRAWHIPFTPGLIPQQKSRIAASIGRVISMQLLNSETIKETILSEKTMLAVKENIKIFFSRYKDDTRTLRQVMESFIEPEKIESYKAAVQTQGTQFLLEKIKEGKIGSRIVQYGINTLRQKMQRSVVGSFIDEDFLKNIENTLGKIVDDTISEQAPEIIQKEIEKIEEDLLAMPLGDIYDLYQEHIPALTEEIVKLYRTAIEENLDKLLAAVNIENIVVEKVNSFDAVQLEQMIFGIMKKELNAIVYLGALLGFLMGFINLLL